MSASTPPPSDSPSEEYGTPVPGRHDERVAIITGASRGIGKAVALRLAAEGAKIVVAAKSVGEPGQRLPGTIHETVEAIAELGGEAMPFQIDVRDERQVEAMVAATVERFGRIDILFNNAGAIFLKPVIEMPPKRYDLVMDVNVRASHVASHFVLPHMVRQRWGHILMFSPEVNTGASPGMSAYMNSKYGMTRTALSIAEEHRGDNVAANALWPVTMIDTAAVRNNQLGDPSQWRSAEIICDAVSELFSREPGACTGRALTDEEILGEAGVSNFDRYWVLGQPPERPVLISGPEAVLR